MGLLFQIVKYGIYVFAPLKSGSGRVPDQLVNLDMKHGVEAKNYEEVS